jgi:hypothetical protein
MLQLIITDRVHRKLFVDNKKYKLISLRPLRKKEIALAKKRGLQKHFLKLLTAEQSENFFRTFDRFWNEAIAEFTPENPFWRNVVSSKMQEWERSAAYLALIIFSLQQEEVPISVIFVIICSSIEEEDLCESWGLKKKWTIQKKSRRLPRWARRFIQEAHNLKNCLYYLAACLYKKWYAPRAKFHSTQNDNEVLIASLFYDNCIHQGAYHDHFFGDLHQHIKLSGHSVTFLSSPIGNYKKSAHKTNEINEVQLILPLSIITWTELFSLMLRVLVRRLRFPRANFDGCDFSKLLSWSARRFDFFFNFDAEIFYLATKKICKKKIIDRLILIYEGNVFERACIQAFRKFSEGIIIGYSHAVVFPLNLKIRVTNKEKAKRPEPDVLVSTGSGTKKLLVEAGNRDPSSITSGCSLRYIPHRNDSPSNDRNFTILVALDGVWSTVSVLNWLMQQANLFKGYKVRLRGHPNVPIEMLLTDCICDKPDNFFISNSSLKEDIASCFCVLYRQTSVGLQALMNGAPVIHLAIDAPLVCDPIRDFTAFKWTISSPEELSQALQEIHAIELGQMKDAIRLSRAYAERYFAPPDNIKTERFYAYDIKNIGQVKIGTEAV